MSFAYAWQDCDSSGASCATVSGATASVYTLGSGDVGHTVRAVVTAKNASGGDAGEFIADERGVLGFERLGFGRLGSGGWGSITCNLNAATSNFSSRAAGRRSVWRRVTMGLLERDQQGDHDRGGVGREPADGDRVQVGGASAFTLNGMTNLSGTIDGGSNITIQNSAFTNGRAPSAAWTSRAR